MIKKPEKVAWKTSNNSAKERVSTPLKISEIDTTKTPRLDTTDEELNRVLGVVLYRDHLFCWAVNPGLAKAL